MLGIIILAVGLLQAAALLSESAERQERYARALFAARAAGRPLLVVGRPKRSHPCGDVTLDLNPAVARECPSVSVASVTAIPYPSGHFGAAFVSHVLEHLPTQDAVRVAVSELRRVADHVEVAGPTPGNLLALLHPDHHVWVRQVDKRTIVTEPW